MAGTNLVVDAPGLKFNDLDPDGDDIFVSNFFQPTHGTLTSIVTNGAFTYVPDEGFTGTDEFQYTLRDAENNFSEPVTVIINVVGPGELPIGSEDVFTVEIGQSLIVSAPGLLINDFDPNGDDIYVSNFFQPTHGTLTSIVTSGAFTYVPDAGFTGTDEFQYVLRDAENNFSNPVSVSINVMETFNRAPIGGGDNYATVAETPLVISAPGLRSNDVDPDGDDIFISNFFQPSHGTLTSIVTSGAFTYVPEAGFKGTDEFQYTLRDAENNFSDPVTVIIEVLGSFNRKPIGISDHYATKEETTLVITAPGLRSNDVDPDGDDIFVSNFFQPTHGTLTSIVTGGAFTYVPDAGFTGTDEFQYTLRDAENNFSDPVTVTLKVYGTYQPPLASANNVVTECEGPAGTAVTLDGSASTVMENATIQYTWYENGSIISGPSDLPTSEVTLSTGIHTVTLIVEDECGNTSSDDATVTIEDTSAPLVQAAFFETGQHHEFEISCSTEDVCSEIVSTVSVILIPDLVNPKITFKNNKNYSLDIDLKKNTVSVKAPNAANFWASILSINGIMVNDGQVISAKSDKDKYKFDFDASGNLVSVKGDVVTLRCTASDGNGNTGVSEATLPASKLKSDYIEASIVEGEDFAGSYRNYPNPFERYTTIEFKLETSAFVNVTVFDQAGRKVEQLVSKQMPEGLHEIIWDAKKNNPGIYYYRIENNGKLLSGKMILQQ